MRLAELVQTSTTVGATRARKTKIAVLAACLSQAAAEEIELTVAYLTGELPQGRIGIGPAALRRALPVAAVSEPALTLLQVDAGLSQIASLSGAGSAARKLEQLRRLLGQATAAEQSFLLRLLLRELRQGALEGVMVEAIASAAGIASQPVRRAHMLCGALGNVARAALTEGEPGLAQLSVRLFQPLRPMLADKADDVAEVLGHHGEAAFEAKFDGARIQVHKQAENVRIFTRHLKEVTGALPEVVEAVQALPAQELILDGEALALAADGRPERFQTTMRRFGRKVDVARLRATLPLSAFFFDCLYLDGALLLDCPAADRFEAMADLLPQDLTVPRLVTSDAFKAERFVQEVLAQGHEGVMAKSLTAPYEAGGRGKDWLKLKPVHTLDLVVLAAEWGSGRRKGWLSNLHLGARDAQSNSFVMLGKTFKGLTDKTLRWQTQRLQELEIARDAWTVYVRPELVVEIAFNDVQASPRYPAGMALRFARVKRYRPDKQAGEADTIASVRQIFES